MDIQIQVPALPYDDLASKEKAEPSSAVRERVNAARTLQSRRLSALGSPAHCNAQMGPREIREACALDADGDRLLRLAVDRLGLSARGFDRLLKVARTVADLDAEPQIQTRHLSEAIQYRALDRVPMAVA